MKEFFKKLLDGNDDTISFTRFTMLMVMIFGMFLLTAVVVAIICGVAIPQFLVGALVTMILGGGGIKAIEKYKTLRNESN